MTTRGVRFSAKTFFNPGRSCSPSRSRPDRGGSPDSPDSPDSHGLPQCQTFEYCRPRSDRGRVSFLGSARRTRSRALPEKSEPFSGLGHPCRPTGNGPRSTAEPRACGAARLTSGSRRKAGTSIAARRARDAGARERLGRGMRNKTPAADHRTQRASHHGQGADPDNRPWLWRVSDDLTRVFRYSSQRCATAATFSLQTLCNRRVISLAMPGTGLPALKCNGVGSLTEGLFER